MLSRYLVSPGVHIKYRFLFSPHLCVTSANNVSKGTDRSPRCQRLGARYRLKCLLSVADATRRTRTSSGRRHVVSSKASATGNFANVRRRIVNGSLSPSFLFIYYSSVFCKLILYSKYLLTSRIWQVKLNLAKLSRI